MSRELSILCNGHNQLNLLIHDSDNTNLIEKRSKQTKFFASPCISLILCTFKILGDKDPIFDKGLIRLAYLDLEKFEKVVCVKSCKADTW